MSFLPTDYEAPSSPNANYVKLLEGENKLRILSAPILGWEDWDDKTPVRYRFNEKPAKSFDPKKPVRHFWAMIVFNYAAEEIQIWHVAQATIRKGLETLVRDNDWGAPYHYDIKVVKSGKDKDTEYAVNPSPHKAVDPYIIEQFRRKPICLEALFTGDDPFAEGQTPTTLFSDSKSESQADSFISVEQKNKLHNLIISDENADECLKTILRRTGADDLMKVKSEKYKAIMEWLTKRLEEQKQVADVPF